MEKLMNIYGHNPSGRGLAIEGRGSYDDWKGSLQPPSFLVQKQEVKFIGFVDVFDPYLGMVKARKFQVIEETFVDISDRINEEPSRIGTHAFWKESYDEQNRKGLRIQNFVSKTPIFRDLCDSAEQHRSDFCDALIIYYQGHLDLGDFSEAQFDKDLRSKEDSSTAFPGFKKNRDVLNAPNKRTIYANEVKDTKSELTWITEHLKLAKDKKYNFKLMDPNFTINALRGRPPKKNFITITPNKVILDFVSYRSRGAGGMTRQSRLGWVIYKTKAKKIILQRMVDFLQTKFKTKIHLMDIESVKFYITAFENSIECYDVSNAEKTWGCVFNNILPGIIDLSNSEKFLDEFAPQLQSGVDITRIINWFGVLLLMEWLIKKQLIPPDLESWQGGDNFGFRYKLDKPQQLDTEDELIYLNRLIGEDENNTVNDGLWHIIDNDDRILGFHPSLGRIFGCHHSIDGVDSMIAWNSQYTDYRWVQNYQTFSRIADNVIQSDWFEKGTCIKFYKWIIARQDEKETEEEFYNHDDIWNYYSSKLFDESNFEQLFPGMKGWIEGIFSVRNLIGGRYVQDSDCLLFWTGSKRFNFTGPLSVFGGENK